MGVVIAGALVVTVAVVGGDVAFVPLDERAGFQMLKNQNEGSVMGADSGPSKNNFVSSIDHFLILPQNSVPLATPKIKDEKRSMRENEEYSIDENIPLSNMT